MIKTVSYGETFNTGNYSSIRIDATVEVTGKKTPQGAIEDARKFVRGEYKKMCNNGVKMVDWRKR